MNYRALKQFKNQKYVTDSESVLLQTEKKNWRRDFSASNYGSIWLNRLLSLFQEWRMNLCVSMHAHSYLYV